LARFAEVLEAVFGRTRHSAWLPEAEACDPLYASIRDGLAAGNRNHRPAQNVRQVARDLRDWARSTQTYGKAITELTRLVRDYPRVEEFQKIVARLLQEADDPRAVAAWLGITKRFPRAMDAFHNLIVLVNRRHGAVVAESLLTARYRRLPKKLDDLLTYAEASEVVGARAQRQAAFERLAQIFGNRKNSWLTMSSWLDEEWGNDLRTPATWLRRFGGGAGLRPPMLSEERRLNAIAEDWKRSARAPLDKGSLPSVRTLAALFDRIIQERCARRGTPRAGRAPVLLLTGSLGAGGAERQVVNTAVGLAQLPMAQRTLSDGLALDPVGVVARSLRDRKDGAFYYPELEAHSIPVHSYRELPDFAGDLVSSAVRPALSALGFLPWATAEAVIKLTDWLRRQNPEVVHIWQDGLVYATGLAALLAGVPRIVLSGRSSPPPDRRENYLVEYDVIYRSLLRASGVTLTVNSHHAARRYGEWLELDSRKIAVIPNGVRLPSLAGDAGAVGRFGDFAAQTGDRSVTLGAVMRMDEVKRPLHWIEAAAAVVTRLPQVRFIIVGEGPFRAKAERKAEALGIAERILFVGRSACVGYWLSKMDMLMLLSAHEGLPNALIEAQLVGVPVVTAPAGGAPEALLPGKTGMVLPADLGPQEIAAIVSGLLAQPDRLRTMGNAARDWATRAFPVSQMLSNTLQLYSAAGCSRAAALSEGVHSDLGSAPGGRIPVSTCIIDRPSRGVFVGLVEGMNDSIWHPNWLATCALGRSIPSSRCRGAHSSRDGVACRRIAPGLSLGIGWADCLLGCTNITI
jgi:glycosyltransferase involved in cell wall biosynthesis